MSDKPIYRTPGSLQIVLKEEGGVEDNLLDQKCDFGED
jgi:hypothetical protein